MAQNDDVVFQFPLAGIAVTNWLAGRPALDKAISSAVAVIGVPIINL